MKVVVVGGGVGGSTAARELMRRGGNAQVTLVDRTLRHDFAPSFLWLMNGTRKAESISRSLRSLESHGVEVVKAEVSNLDADSQTVVTDQGSVDYDELILAPGAKLAPEQVPGLGEAAETFYSRDAAERLHTRLAGFEGGRVVVVVAAMPYKCPAAPYEAAFLACDLFKRRGVQAEITVVTAEPQPLPVAGPEIGHAIKKMLTASGIAFKPNCSLQSVDGGESHFADGGSEPYDLLIAVPPHKTPDFLMDSPLAGDKGWIPVDPSTLEAAPHVYAIGDVTAIELPNGKLLPKAGVFAHTQGKIVARNLLSSSSARKRQFKGTGACFLEVGAGKAGFARGDFYATPAPRVKMRRPSRIWHLGKVLFERNWLRQLK